MVRGPEFGPIAALSVAAVHRRHSIAGRAFRSFTVGFACAIGVTTLLAVVARWLGWINESVLTGDRGDRVHHPSGQVSFIVAFIAGIAGIAGVLVLTSAKSGGLVGVFIPVTTVPAAEIWRCRSR